MSHSAVDLLFLVGVLAVIVKGGDLFLRDHQKKALQSYCEDMTLWLEEQNPIKWFRSLSSPRAHRWLILIGVAEFAIVGVMAIFVQRSAEASDNFLSSRKVIATQI